jgi:hypothetical protein
MMRRAHIGTSNLLLPSCPTVQFGMPLEGFIEVESALTVNGYSTIPARPFCRAKFQEKSNEGVHRKTHVVSG